MKLAKLRRPIGARKLTGFVQKTLDSLREAEYTLE